MKKKKVAETKQDKKWWLIGGFSVVILTLGIILAILGKEYFKPESEPVPGGETRLPFQSETSGERLPFQALQEPEQFTVDDDDDDDDLVCVVEFEILATSTPTPTGTPIPTNTPTPTPTNTPTPTPTKRPTNTPTPTSTPTSTPTLTVTPTVTSTPTPEYWLECSWLRIYDQNWNLIVDYSQIQVGDTIYLVVAGATNHPLGITNARFRIYVNGTGGAWLPPTGPVTTPPVPSYVGGDFYLIYQVNELGDYRMQAQVYNPVLGWR